MVESEKEDPLSLLDLSDSYEDSELDAAAAVVSNLIIEFEATIPADARQFHFWNGYLNAVQALLSLIRSECVGNWNFDIDSLIMMLPVVYAYDRSNIMPDGFQSASLI